jgi:cytochrome c heme-lyase
VCPVKHTAKPADAAAGAAADKPAVCPVKHRGSATAAAAGTHGSAALLGGKDAAAASETAEPGDTADRFVRAVGARARAAASAATEDLSKIEHGDEVPGGRIPATGRGNSEDGSDWVNPTPKELFRALRRKQKHIDEEDAFSVAFVHSAVVDQTWEQIMAYEALHADECDAPTLNRFEGKYGDHTIKTKLTHYVYPHAECFDRHDWYVNRCGKEIHYIIDYYSTPGEHGAEEYFIDARPAPTVSGLIDRARLAFRRYRAGESVW